MASKPRQARQYTPLGLFIIISFQIGITSMFADRLNVTVWGFWTDVCQSCIDGIYDQNEHITPFRPDHQNWFRNQKREGE